MHKYIIPYFLLLAILVGGMGALHLKPTMPTILTSMVVAGIVLGGLWGMGQLIKRKMSTYGLSRRQWAAVMMGHAPDAFGVVEAAKPWDERDYTSPPAGALVPRQDLYPVPYQPDVEDEDELPDAIIESDGMHLADTFQPSVHSFLGMVALIVGMRRFGKSNLLAVIIEVLAPLLLPILLCDTKGEYAGLVHPAYMPHGRMAGAPGYRDLPPNLTTAYMAVNQKGAFEFGKAIMEGHLQVVLNLKSYETDDEAARVMCEIIRGINAWQESRANDQRVPVEIAVDEAHKWLPQNLRESCVSEDTQDRLHQTFFSTIVRMGGAFGFGLILATQRIAEIDKRALQVLWQFLFFQSQPVDVAIYEKKNLPKSEIMTLRPGECFVFSPQAIGFRVMIRRRSSPDLSCTPGMDQLAHHRREAIAKRDMVSRRVYTDHPSAALPAISHTQRAVPTIAFEDEPGEDAYVPEDAASDDVPEQALTTEEQTAWEWYCKGNRSGRKLAAAMNISDGRGNKLLNRLIALGYAQKEPGSA